MLWGKLVDTVAFCRIVGKAFLMLMNPKKRRQLSMPKTLEEAVNGLLDGFQSLSQEEKTQLLEVADPQDFATIFHHTGGRAIRNRWNLWNPDGQLHKHFKERFGLFHADDMSSMIYQCTWQVLHDIKPTPNEFAKHFHEYWDAMEKGGEVNVGKTTIKFNK